MANFILTIDGPAASGKSSVSRELARRFGWSWVSTGAFYRGLAYVAHVRGTDLANEDALVELANKMSESGSTWQIKLTADQTLVFLDGKDVTEEIGREHVGSLASKISSFPKLRRALLEAQRHCANGISGLIAEGRDCGTVVFPNAQLKVFLTARAEDRAARRARDEGADFRQLIDEQKQRDHQDSSRKIAPMQASQDSFTIDTSDLGFSEVVSRIESLVRERLPS